METYLSVLVALFQLIVFADATANFSTDRPPSDSQNERFVLLRLDELATTSAFFRNIFHKNSTCRLHSDIVREEAIKLNIQALKMMDASAKFPSGVLSGNLNQYGDFDECVSASIRTNTEFIKGKYCLATIGIKFKDAKKSENLSLIDELIHSHRMFTNQLDDAGHRIPKQETFNWGLCIPNSCTNNDLESALKTSFDNFSDRSIQIDVRVSEGLCFEEESRKFTLENALALLFFVFVAFVVLTATLIDLYAIKCGELSQYLLCFSIRKNFSDLVQVERTWDEIGVLHGIRFLNAIALLLCHKQMALMFNPFVNRTEMSGMYDKPWTMIARSAILYTDTFILISGLLLAYAIVKELDEKGRIDFKGRLITRLFRFTPNLFALVIFCTFLMEHMGTGPQWGLVVQQYADLCKRHMWRNFLYVHNYFGFENMCLTHTHQLGIDMQLFLISPIVIYTLWRKTWKGLLVASTLGCISTYVRYHVTLKEGLSTIIYYGISVERLWKTANLSYILPTHRLTVYVVGIALGYFLRRNGKRLSLSYRWKCLGWMTAILSGVLAMFGPYHMSSKNYVYNAGEAAFNNAFLPLLWVVFLSWAIVAIENGWGGWSKNFLSWKYFAIFSRISYAVYLIQFPVFFYNVGIQRSPKYYSGLHSMIDVPELFLIFALSVAMTLVFELPFQKLRKLGSHAGEKVKRCKEKRTESVLNPSPNKDFNTRRLENHAD